MQVYRGQSVGIDDVAPDTVSTGSKDDPADSGVANFCDLEKASLPDEVNGLDRSSPVKYGAGWSDADVDERQWVLLDCHFGVPLFDADVNRSVCRRIAKHGLCNQARYFTLLCTSLLVRMEWRPAGWSVCLPLLIFPCTTKSRSSLLAPAHPGGPGKRAVKRLWWWLHQLEHCNLMSFCPRMPLVVW